MTDRPGSPRYHSTSLARALTILDLFETETPSLSVSLLKARVTEGRQHKIAQEVVRTTAIISGAMRYRPTRWGGPDNLRMRGDRVPNDAPTLHMMSVGKAPLSMSGGRGELVRESP